MFILTIKTSVTFYNHLYLRGWLAILSMATNGKHESISIIFPTSDFLFRHFIDFDCSDFTQVAFNWHECKGRTLLAVICALCKVYSHFPSIHTTARGELSTPFGASKLQLQFQSIKREAKRMWTCHFTHATKAPEVEVVLAKGVNKGVPLQQLRKSYNNNKNIICLCNSKWGTNERICGKVSWMAFCWWKAI